jgi:hypothetical protein
LRLNLLNRSDLDTPARCIAQTSSCFEALGNEHC